MLQKTLIAIAIAGAAAGLASCAKQTSSPFTETAAVCDNGGIESTRSAYREQTQEWRSLLRRRANVDANMESERNNLFERLDVYDAEIDAQYRTVTSACKSYTRCMEMNKYKEGRCTSNMTRWQNSEREFTDLSRELKEIEARVTIVLASRPFGPPPPRVNKCDSGVCY